MDDIKKAEVVQAFRQVAVDQPVRKDRGWSGWRRPSLRIRGSHNSVQIVMSRVDDEGATKRRLVAQALSHVGRIGARELLASWMRREFSTGMLTALSLPELRRAHREILSWSSAAG
jgi:hypothetical protein